MDIKENYFELFDIPVQFRVDQKELSSRYRELQRAYHPDRFTQQSDQEQRLALQYSSYVNEAYEVLASPVRRAEYLLKLHGIERDQSKTLSSDPQFLMQQMEWREALEGVRENPQPETALEDLRRKALSEQDGIEKTFISLMDQAAFQQASINVDKMHFLDKLLREIEQLEDEFLDF